MALSVNGVLGGEPLGWLGSLVGEGLIRRSRLSRSAAQQALGPPLVQRVATRQHPVLRLGGRGWRRTLSTSTDLDGIGGVFDHAS